MIISEEDYLQHFGVKGMHWGQRKTSKPKKSAQAKAQQRYKNVQRVNKAVGVIGLAAFGAIKIAQFDQHVAKNPAKYVKTADFMGKQAGKSMKFVKAATKGAKFAFKKDSVVFSPGTFVPGSFVNAGARALGQGAKALTA